ncbi:MAG: WD40/YVTN/BNR-like repeat-containing protein [Bryobacteraceae bacterium]
MNPLPAPAKKPLDKPREDWFFRRSAFPLRDAAPTELESFWENQNAFPRALDVEWQEAGPTNYSGRVTCLAVQPGDTKRIYAGSGGGGLWTSADRGDTWECIWPKYLNQNIGAVAVSPRTPRLLYCATGEGNLSSGTYPGSGVFCSLDSGFTWRPFLSAPGGGVLSADARLRSPRRITVIAFGPGEKGRTALALGSSTKSEALHAGIFIDRGGPGVRFVDFWGNRSYNCYALVFHPATVGLLYAGIETGGTQNGIWRSEDSGITWRQLSVANGLPPGDNCGRIALAICPADPDILYAMIAGRRGGVLGVYRTEDSGEKWERTISPELASETQMSYNSAIAVHPADSNFVICGGTDLHVTHNGGQNWRRLTTGKRDAADGTFSTNFVHFDHHAIAMLEDGWIYSGNDGGLSISNNRGVTWSEKAAGMVTTMFYDLDVAPADSRIFGGGAQDTGSLIAGVTPDGTNLAEAADHRHFTRVLGGDGGWMVFDPKNLLKVFGTTADAARPPFIHRHDPGRKFSHGDRLGGWVGLGSIKLTRPEQLIRSLTLLVIQPAHGKHRQRLWLATSRLWRSVDDGATWQIGSQHFDGSPISALEFASVDPALVFVGTTEGRIYRSRNGGLSWSGDLAGPEIPRRLITQIEVHPENAAIVVCTVAASGAPAAALDGDDRPFAHVFRSSDGGDTWEDIDRGALPNVVYNGLAFETHPPFRIFVGGDAGVWVLQDGRFLNINGVLPNVIVSDLIYHHKDRMLFAATYGRGIWRLPLAASHVFEAEPNSDIVDAPIPAAGLVREIRVPAPKPLSPANEAKIDTFPRDTVLRWKPVPDAIGYMVEIVYNQRFFSHETTREPTLKFEGDSMGDAIWRVWAILPNSRRTVASTARRIHYLR